jgi:hypothetical protein
MLCASSMVARVCTWQGRAAALSLVADYTLDAFKHGELHKGSGWQHVPPLNTSTPHLATAGVASDVFTCLMCTVCWQVRAAPGP